MARSGKRRKKRTHVREAAEAAFAGQPKSFVLRRGRHAALMKELEKDLRKMMMPNTATSLRESRRNVLKDFVQVAGPLGITHFLMLSATEHASYLRVVKVPRGPSLTLRIHKYALQRDVLSSQQRPRAPKTMWQSAPLVVLNNFTGSEHLKLAAVTFQNMFPAINVATTKLSNCQRVLLLDYNAATDRIQLRQYSIGVQASGVTKNLKSLIGQRNVPDLGNCADVADFLTKSAYGSESEADDPDATRVQLDPDSTNSASRQSRVKLYEVGPRLEMELVKIEEGLCEGRVLYHAHIHKTAEEVAELRDKTEERQRLRRERRLEQEENVRRKEKEKKRRTEVEQAAVEAKKARKGPVRAATIRNEASDMVEDDDAAYYREEVGEEPEPGMAGAKKKPFKKQGRKRA